MEAKEIISLLHKLRLRKIPADGDLIYFIDNETNKALLEAIEFLSLTTEVSIQANFPTDEDILEGSGRYQYQSIKGIKGTNSDAMREECVAFYWGAKWLLEQIVSTNERWIKFGEFLPSKANIEYDVKFDNGTEGRLMYLSHEEGFDAQTEPHHIMVTHYRLPLAPKPN